MLILIIEDDTVALGNGVKGLQDLGHTVIACQSIAEWRRRIQPAGHRDKKPETGYYNCYNFHDQEIYPSFNEKDIDLVMTDLFLPVDGTNLGYRLTEKERRDQLPYGYVIALRYLSMGKKVAIVTKGEYGSVDHHDSPLLSINDFITVSQCLEYKPCYRVKDYLSVFNTLL